MVVVQTKKMVENILSDLRGKKKNIKKQTGVFIRKTWESESAHRTAVSRRVIGGPQAVV